MKSPTFSPPVAPQSGSGKKAILSPLKKDASVVVIGAGVFGVWTALLLLKKGLQVTLIDAWGPGNSRASSGGESRLIRSIYGDNKLYFQMARRSMELWKQYQHEFNQRWLFLTGILWFAYEPRPEFLIQALPFFDEYQVPYEKLTTQQSQKLFPQIQVQDLHHILWEKESGFLLARESCQQIVQGFVNLGGKFVNEKAIPGPIKNEKLDHIQTSNQKAIKADGYVFACGPWLGQIFPEILGNVINPTRQEVYYFGISDSKFDNLPCWVDWNPDQIYYGVAQTQGRGFKIACHKRGESFDPNQDDRVPTLSMIEEARNFLGHRFPSLKNAPLLESRVCQYENSPDGNFILDVHPEANNLWIIGGGSGHGFKHGPAVGELATDMILGNKKVLDVFSLKRFNQT